MLRSLSALEPDAERMEVVLVSFRFSLRSHGLACADVLLH